jgi:hypothetical protein
MIRRHNILPMRDNPLTASTKSIPKKPSMAVRATHAKLEYPSTRSPMLYTHPTPLATFLAYRAMMKASSLIKLYWLV